VLAADPTEGTVAQTTQCLVIFVAVDSKRAEPVQIIKSLWARPPSRTIMWFTLTFDTADEYKVAIKTVEGAFTELVGRLHGEAYIPKI